MFNSKRKLLLIGILSILAISLLVGMGLPALADQGKAKNPASAALPPVSNLAVVTGNLSVIANSITIMPETAPSIALAALPSQNVTIVYNSTNGTIHNLIVHRSGQQILLSKPANNQFSSMNGTLTVTGNLISIIAFPPPSVVFQAPPHMKIKIVYDKTSGIIQALLARGPGFQIPTLKQPPVNHFASVQGNVTIASNVLTIMPNHTSQVALTIEPGQKVNIVYNSTNGAVKMLRLVKPGQNLSDLKGPANQKFTSVTGTVSVAANVITIKLDVAQSINLNLPAKAKALVVFNKTTGSIKNLTLLGHNPAPAKGSELQKPGGQGNQNGKLNAQSGAKGNPAPKLAAKKKNS